MDNQTSAKMSPKDFFLHLGSLVVLYVGFGSLVSLLFRVIDATFPSETGFFAGGIAWPVAILIILAPLYVVLFWFIRKSYQELPKKKDLAIRKWLTYLTLFVAGIIIVGNLITVLYYFLDGQLLTTGFLLKIFSLLVLAGLVFTFYLFDLRDKLNKKGYLGFATTGLVVILLSIIAGFSVLGSPATQRAIRQDQIRTNHLQDIQSRLTNYWQNQGSLPETLAAIEDSLAPSGLPTDPATGNSYLYTKTGELSFTLCAEFARVSQNQINYPHYPYGFESENWSHEAGEYCFERKINPELYPSFKR